MSDTAKELSESKSASLLTRRIVRGMIIILFFGLFGKLGGFLMNMIVASYYGTGPILDAFTAVYGKIFILFFFSSLLKVVMPAFMPLFSECVNQENKQNAWHFTNTVINAVLATGILASVAAFIFAPQITSTLLPEFSPEAGATAETLLRWMAPGVVIAAFAVVAQGILNSYKIFAPTPAAEATQKLLWAGAILVAISVFGFSKDTVPAAHVIGAAFLVGCVGQAVVLIIGLGKKLKFYRLSFPATTIRRLAIECGWVACVGMLAAIWIRLLHGCASLPQSSWWSISTATQDFLTITGLMGIAFLYSLWLWHRGRGKSSVMARFAQLAAWLLIGVVGARYRDLGLTQFQSYTAEGVFGLIELAGKVVNQPVVLVPTALSVAMLPYFCDLVARNETENLGRIVGHTIRIMALFFLPITALFMALGTPIMQMLFDRGTWTPELSRTAGLALSILATGIFFLAIENILMQSFFSLQRVVLPTTLGIFFSLMTTFVLYAIIRKMSFDNPTQTFFIICVAYPLPRALKNICLMLCLGRHIKLMSAQEAFIFFVKMFFLCAFVAATAWGGHALMANLMPLEGIQFVRSVIDLARQAQLNASRMTFTILFEIGKVFHLAATCTAALAIFVTMCVAVRIEEFGMALRWIRQRGWSQKHLSANSPFKGGGDSA